VCELSPVQLPMAAIYKIYIHRSRNNVLINIIVECDYTPLQLNLQQHTGRNSGISGIAWSDMEGPRGSVVDSTLKTDFYSKCPTGITYIISRFFGMPVTLFTCSAWKPATVTVPSPSAVAWRQIFCAAYPASR
jgi:hypothetical protein